MADSSSQYLVCSLPVITQVQTSKMKAQFVLLLVAFAAVALARPADIIDFETDNMEHEQEGQAGRSVTGEYSWVAPNGEEFKVEYIADHLGYRVLESNAQPEFRAADVAAPEEEGEEEEGEEEEGEEEESEE
ncbi:Insect cuticle protein [Trinorchestia longiramus]|nr:Insect cuticle protein [Trinorchestia longiramus]